jgi:hypothetical protein
VAGAPAAFEGLPRESRAAVRASSHYCSPDRSAAPPQSQACGPCQGFSRRFSQTRLRDPGSGLPVKRHSVFDLFHHFFCKYAIGDTPHDDARFHQRTRHLREDKVSASQQPYDYDSLFDGTGSRFGPWRSAGAFDLSR